MLGVVGISMISFSNEDPDLYGSGTFFGLPDQEYTIIWIRIYLFDVMICKIYSHFMSNDHSRTRRAKKNLTEPEENLLQPYYIHFDITIL